ncbi:unnamed protein product [Didymodactylos carnosus]|uniref:Uncharacterized protein n=1 Tax=Didymodactylos carnosus TaxID=1234261 RepID=A0A814VLT8_9BILA|nr:unnamed protein product [Didymodactylos carnosus]CAF1187172.1 unnamed protein product [Didymodactylos carnosus]CAF3759551.1 unnamed protein product [Didymodactylos carnosus]CAF3951437.1 unnamed protein product [Didymodactylos carnosus]
MDNWTVTMKGRHFSSVACDYAIESTQNKDFKGPAGLSGHVDADLRLAWSLSSTWCAQVLTVVDELSNVKQTNDPHVQATQSRIVTDNKDLSKMITILKTDNSFQSNSKDFYKILSGVKLPNEIVDELCNASTKFVKTANNFIKETLIDKKMSIFTTINKGNVRLLTSSLPPEKPLSNNNNEKLFKSLMYCSLFRSNINLSVICEHEFITPPLSLINKNEPTFQHKTSTIPFISDFFPETIMSDLNQQTSVIILDGDVLLSEQRRCDTYGEYANNMFLKRILPLTSNYHRIDVVFSCETDFTLHDIIAKNENKEKKLSINQLKSNFIMPRPSEWEMIAKNNRSSIGQCVCNLWQTSNFDIPKEKLIMVSCPDKRLLLMTKEQGNVFVQNIIPEQYDINSRVIEHCRTTIEHYESNTVCIKSKKNDVLVLAVAYADSLQFNLIVDCSYVYRSEPIQKFINCTELNLSMRRKYNINSIKPIIMLHALSGSEYTSYIRNVTKSNLINTYFENKSRFKFIENLDILQLRAETINDCEILLLQTLKSQCKTLDEERYNMIKKWPRKFE